jgi:hypothetical protein
VQAFLRYSMDRLAPVNDLSLSLSISDFKLFCCFSSSFGQENGGAKGLVGGKVLGDGEERREGEAGPAQ